MVSEKSSQEASSIATNEFVGVTMAEFVVTADWLKVKITKAKNQIIFWMFLFWATEIGAIFAFLKFLR
jgi:hypothetical protein